jgi:putative tricarboxylic transport membrane protein
MRATTLRLAAATAATLVAAGAVSACSSHGSSSSGPATPTVTQFVVDTGPGGGSDLFARQVVKIANGAKIISANWPVFDDPDGGGLGAMATLKGKSGSSSYIAAFTSKWIIAGLSTPSAPATLDDLTPIAAIADETQVIAAPENAPYDTMAGFIAAAKAKPGTMVQTGGSINSVDNLIALEIEKNAGAKWKYLSFDDGGPRITALLRGDAQIDIGAEADFHDQIVAKKLKLIGIISPQRLAGYPDVSTLAQQGISLGQLPAELQFRGIAGPPGMPASAVTYFQSKLAALVKDPAYVSYLKTQGLVAHFVTGPALKTLLANFTTSVKPLVASLPKSG